MSVLNGPALIKVGRTGGEVREFYGVFLFGRLALAGNGNEPREFKTFNEADIYYGRVGKPS